MDRDTRALHWVQNQAPEVLCHINFQKIAAQIARNYMKLPFVSTISTIIAMLGLNIKLLTISYLVKILSLIALSEQLNDNPITNFFVIGWKQVICAFHNPVPPHILISKSHISFHS